MPENPITDQYVELLRGVLYQMSSALLRLKYTIEAYPELRERLAPDLAKAREAAAISGVLPEPPVGVELMSSRN